MVDELSVAKAAATFLVLSLASCFVAADESVRCCTCVLGQFGEGDPRCVYNVVQHCVTKEVTDYSGVLPVERPFHDCVKSLEYGTYNKADKTCVGKARTMKLDVCQPLNTGMHMKAWTIQSWKGKRSCKTPCY